MVGQFQVPMDWNGGWIAFGQVRMAFNVRRKDPPVKNLDACVRGFSMLLLMSTTMVFVCPSHTLP
jgi:hypothetical protein